MTRSEMISNFDDLPMSAKYVVVGTQGDGEIVREFGTLDDAKRAGLKLWASGLVQTVHLHKPRGKSHRLVPDERCTRRKRGKMTWTR